MLPPSEEDTSGLLTDLGTGERTSLEDDDFRFSLFITKEEALAVGVEQVEDRWRTPLEGVASLEDLLLVDFGRMDTLAGEHLSLI